jgi:hypothetical protein
MYSEQIENMIRLAIIDGQITEKEWEVLLKKATEAGIDLDEFKMIVEARLYESNLVGKEKNNSISSHDFTNNSTVGENKKTNLITTGYILAFMPILILPIVFTLAGVGVGIVNISKGENRHGITQIVIAVIAGVIGTIIGGAGFNL